MLMLCSVMKAPGFGPMLSRLALAGAALLAIGGGRTAHAGDTVLPGYKTLWPSESPRPNGRDAADPARPPMRVILPQTRSVSASPAVREAAPRQLRPAPRAQNLRALRRLNPELLRWIQDAAGRFDLPSALVLAVIHAESHFLPAAVSPRNAVGLMQVLPGTAQDMGLKATPEQTVAGLLRQPRINLVVGSRYLAEQWDRFGRLDLALAAYNAGPNAVLKAGQRIPNYPETQAYVRRVLTLYQHYDRVLLAAGVDHAQEPA